MNAASGVDIAAVFAVLPKPNVSNSECTSVCACLDTDNRLQLDWGLDLNPLFTGIDLSGPAGLGDKLRFFDLAGIMLVHG